MKPHASPTSNIALALIVLSLGASETSSIVRGQVAGFRDHHAVEARSSYLPAAGGSNDEEQVYLAADSVSSELPRTAYFEDEAGKPLVIAGTNRRRDLGLYLSYLRERGPPL